MSIALVIVTVLAAGIAAASAAMKLTGNAQVIESMATVKVPPRLVPLLAGTEAAGAVGALIGLAVRPLGIAATVGLVAYFALAIGAHLRVGDTKGAPSPALPLVLSVAALVLRIVVD